MQRGTTSTGSPAGLTVRFAAGRARRSRRLDDVEAARLNPADVLIVDDCRDGPADRGGVNGIGQHRDAATTPPMCCWRPAVWDPAGGCRGTRPATGCNLTQRSRPPLRAGGRPRPFPLRRWIAAPAIGSPTSPRGEVSAKVTELAGRSTSWQTRVADLGWVTDPARR